MQMKKSFYFLYYKKVAKGGGIHRMKKHLVEVKEGIRPCKSIPPDVRFQMENSLQEFVKSKRIAHKAYEYEHLYGPNMPQFKGNMLEYKEEV